MLLCLIDSPPSFASQRDVKFTNNKNVLFNMILRISVYKCAAERTPIVGIVSKLLQLLLYLFILKIYYHINNIERKTTKKNTLQVE